MSFKPIIQLLRPEQWIKNFFLFLPVFFNGQLLNVNLLLQCIIAFFAFSFAASSIYCFNDIYDIESDRKHPEKCKRPIASGAISIFSGYIIMTVSLIVSLLILLFFGGETKYSLLGIIAFYCAMNTAYCIKLKHHAIIDVMIISIGFVLRIFMGGYATGIELSEWIILMTFLLSLFLAFAKRRDDVILYRNMGVVSRKHTNRYNLEFLNLVMTVTATITIIAYIMYTLSPDVTKRFDSNHIYLTAIFVLAGIMRYLQLSIVDLKSGNPTNILLHDRFIQVCIAGWIVSFSVIIYL